MSATQHPSAESLWTLEGDGVGRHIATCAQCAGERDQLDVEQSGLAGRLASLAGEVTVPAQVAQRVHAALAAQARGHDAAVASPPRAEAGHEDGGHGWTRWLVAASVAALAVLGVGALTSLLDRGDPVAGDVTAVTAPGAPDEVDTSADALAQEESGEVASAPATGGADLPGLPADLLVLGRSLTPGETASTGCGTSLAADVGSTVLASRDLVPAGFTGVLVLLDEPDGGTLWWVPDCAAGPASAWGRTALD